MNRENFVVKNVILHASNRFTDAWRKRIATAIFAAVALFGSPALLGQKVYSQPLTPSLSTLIAAPQTESKVLSTGVQSIRVDASIALGLSTGQPQTVIVEFAYASIQARSALLRSPDRPDIDPPEALALKATLFAELKQQMVSALDMKDMLVTKDYSHLPMIAMQIHSEAALQRLLLRPEIVAVHANQILYPALAESLPLMGQPTVADWGHSGVGTTVAVIDSGVDYTRTAFGSCPAPGGSCKVVVAMDFAPDDGQLDGSGHGTNVAAVVLGVASGTTIAALDVFSGATANTTDVVNAINWSIANKTAYNIVAMNLSLGGGGYSAPCGGWGETPFANARAAGIIPVVASGNNGFTNGMSMPACAPSAVSVGAVYDSDIGPMSWQMGCTDSATAADKVTCFSNSASFLTLVAPGSSILAADIAMSGTSQAAPHVAGAVALLREAFPSETLTQTISRMTDNGVPVLDSRNNITKPRLSLPSMFFQMPDLVVTNITPIYVGTIGVVSLGFTATVQNIGARPSGAYALGIYLSTDSTITTNDTLIARCQMAPISAGSEQTCTSYGAYVPANLNPGTYSLGAFADDTRVVGESNENNNTRSTQIALSLPPTVPSNFTATTVSSSQIDLSWGVSTDSAGSGIAGYAVEYCAGVSCSDWRWRATTVSTSYSDSGLAATSFYSYRARAYDNSGNYSAYTNIASATTLANAAEIFPPNCQVPSGWTMPGAAHSGWSVVTNDAYEGTCSLKSNSITNSQTAQIQFDGTFASGNVSFSRKVSSEGGHDCLRFHVDGVQQAVGGTCDSTGGIGASGEVPWATVSVPISAGTHTLVWSFEKDSSALMGQDAAWIDAVVLPTATAVPVVVLSPTTLTFTSQNVGSITAAQTVTLTNFGGSTLSISGITASGDYAKTTTCGATLATAASCTISITFTPTAMGPRSGLLSIASDAAGSPHGVGLSGAVQTLNTPMVAAGGFHSIALKSNGTVVAWGSNGHGQLGDGTISSRTSPVAVPGLSGVVAVATGVHHSIALKSDGTVVAWGRNNFSQLGDGTATSRSSPAVVTGLTGVVAVAAGYQHNLALKSDGTVVAWGSNDSGQLGGGTIVNSYSLVPVPGLTGVVAVAADGFHSIALKSDGTVVAWGANDYGQLGDGTTTSRSSPVVVIGLTGVVAVSAGSVHSLALKSDGTVVAWGRNNFGQLGDGTATSRSIPVAVTGLSGVVALTAGGFHSIALKSDGTVVAWGTNNFGQLGDGTTTSRSSPVAVAGLTGVVAVAAGNDHSLALKSDGAVVAWGDNIFGQLGDSTTTNRTSAITVTGGLNLGSNRSTTTLSPTALTFSSQNTGTSSSAQTLTLTNTGGTTLPVSFISASGDYTKTTTCGATLTAGASCTVSVTFTPLAAGAWSGAVTIISNGVIVQSAPLSGTGAITATVSLNPTSLIFTSQNVGSTSAGQTITLTNIGGATLNISSITASGDFAKSSTCGATLAAGANCTISVTFAPTTAGVRNGSVVIASDAAGSPHSVSVSGTGQTLNTPMVSAGIEHSIALKADGSVFAWGLNDNGQLGDGTTIRRSSPVAVTGLTGVVAVAAGPYHNLALKSDGTVMAWGYNGFGQLGNGTISSLSGLVMVTGLNGVVAIAANGNYSLALKSDGTVMAWGLNSNGQLGDGTTTNRSTPVVVTGLTGVVALTAGGAHSLALKSDGTVVAWGLNSNGQLGDGTTTDRSSPVVVAGLTGVVTLAAGGAHSLALKSDGAVMAWGFNNNGQLGDNTTTNRIYPVAVTGISGVVVLAAGTFHSLALKADGTLMDWGSNVYGQLGDGSNALRSSPVMVADLSGVVAVTSGPYHNVALRSDSSMVAWGYNSFNQLGDGTTINRNSPVVVVGGLNLGSTTSTTMLSPTTLAFGAQSAGTSSAAQTLTLTNTSGTTLTVSSISASGDYTKTTNCGVTLAAGASCTISVSFTPRAVGARNGALVIVGNQRVILNSTSLSGMGANTATVSLNPTSLVFPSENVGSTSAVQTITLTNSGGATLNIGSITASGDFTNSSTCGVTLASGANCTISLTFTPTAAGARSGSVVVTSDSASSPDSVSLSGTGVALPGISLNATSLTFTGRTVGTTSAAQTVVLTNTGSASLTFTSVNASGDFAVTQTCGSSLAVAASCNLNVTFTPTLVGARTGSVAINTNATGSPHSVSLSGTGIASNSPVCTLTAAPATVRKNGTSVLTSSCTNSPTSYSWTGGSCAGTTAATCTVAPSVSTTYGITATNGFGSGSASATVTVATGDITPILFLLLFD